MWNLTLIQGISLYRLTLNIINCNNNDANQQETDSQIHSRADSCGKETDKF